MLSDQAPPPDNPDAGGIVIPKVVPPLPRENPHARNLPWSTAFGWLAAGWKDLWTDPVPSLLYGLGARRVRPHGREALWMHVAMLIAALSAFGPLDDWAETSTSLHMLQHMLFMLAVAPLWALGRPLPQWRAMLGATLQPLWNGILRAARYPVATAMVHGALIWIWHTPRVSCWRIDLAVCQSSTPEPWWAW